MVLPCLPCQCPCYMKNVRNHTKYNTIIILCAHKLEISQSIVSFFTSFLKYSLYNERHLHWDLYFLRKKCQPNVEGSFTFFFLLYSYLFISRLVTKRDTRSIFKNKMQSKNSKKELAINLKKIEVLVHLCDFLWQRMLLLFFFNLHKNKSDIYSCFLLVKLCKFHGIIDISLKSGPHFKLFQRD